MKRVPQSHRIKIKDPHSEQSELSSNQENPDFTSNFEQANELFVLRSTINEANLTIQKMAIQQQQQLIDQHRFYSKIEAEKKQIESRQETLVEQIKKLTTIAEAERNAKSTYASKLKELKQEMYQLKKALKFNEDAQLTTLLQQIQNRQNKMTQMQSNIEAARRQLVDVRREKDQQSKKKIMEIESNIKILEESYRQKIADQEKKLNMKDQQLKTLKEQLKQYMKKTDDMGVKNLKLERVQMELVQTNRRWEEQCRINAKKEKIIVDLKVKEELLAITKEKWQQDKVNFNEQLEQLTFKLEITSKKLQNQINRLKDEERKNNQLEEIVTQLKDKLQKNDVHRIEQQETISQLQQEVKVYKIYEQKFRKAQTTIEEQQTTVEYLTTNCQGYANQIHIIQQQLRLSEQQKQQIEDANHMLRQQIENKQKQITKNALSCSYHNDLLKQCKLELAKCRSQLKEAQQEASKKRSFIEVPKQNCSESPENHEREQWQKMTEEIAEHYQQMLKMEDINRQNLQNQLQNSNKTILQLQSHANQQNREKNELIQENRLLQQQNQRLTKTISNIQKNYDTKIGQFRSRYKSIDLSVNSQQNKKSINRPQNKMRIYNTLNVCHSFHGTKTKDIKFEQEPLHELHSWPSHPTQLQRQKYTGKQSLYHRHQKSQADEKKVVQESDSHIKTYKSPDLKTRTQVSQPSKSNISALERQIQDFQQRNKNIRHRLNI